MHLRDNPPRVAFDENCGSWLDQFLTEAADASSHAPERLAAVLREWRATAEAYAHPDILAALTRPPADCGPVPEPAG